MMFDEKEKAIQINTEFEQNVKELMDAPGYLVFVAKLSDKKDKDLNRIVEYRLLKRNFPRELIPDAFVMFRKHCIKDIFGE